MKDNTIPMILVLFFNSLIILRELMELRGKPSQYFKELDNNLDSIAIVSIYISVILIENNVTIAKDIFMYIAITIALVRGIFYLRNFRILRHFIRLLLMIIKDMFAFSILLIFTVISSSCLYM